MFLAKICRFLFVFSLVFGFGSLSAHAGNGKREIKSFSFINPETGQVIKTASAGHAVKLNLDGKKGVLIRVGTSGNTNSKSVNSKSINFKISDPKIKLKQSKLLAPPYEFFVQGRFLATTGSYKISARLAGKNSSASKMRFSVSSLDSGSSNKGPAGNGSLRNGSGGTDVKPAADIPFLSQWEEQMVKFGRIHCAEIKDSSLPFDTRLLATYYDAEWIYHQIGDYTGDSSWQECAKAAQDVYYSQYVLPNGGKVPGYWNFTHGLARHFLSTGDQVAHSAVVLLSQNASYAPDLTPADWTVDASFSREVAYALMSYINSQDVGESHRPRMELLVSQALGHMDQWFGSKTAAYVRPFMFALSSQALISYEEEIGDNPKILPAIAAGADWIWDHTWLPDRKAFQYTDRVVESGNTDPAPDLNLLIAPVYAWLWHQTGQTIYRDRADQIFGGGVEQAYLVNAKQFNQSYRWSFAYIKWRSMPTLKP
jgi:hypothetical protein